MNTKKMIWVGLSCGLLAALGWGAADDPHTFNLSVAKTRKVLTRPEIEQELRKLRPGTKTLNLEGQRAVDDALIKELSANPAATSLINISLKETSVTDAAVQALFESAVGTTRDLPQFSARFDRPSTQLALDVGGTRVNPAAFSKPKGPFNIEYQVAGFPSNPNGIKMMEFSK